MNELKRLFKWIWISFVTGMVLLAISLTVFRALTPWAAQYKGELETRLTEMFGAPVTIKEMKTSWYWFEPVLKLDDVKIQGQDKQNMGVRELLIGINVPRSLFHWRIQPGVLWVEDGTLGIQQKGGEWQIKGVMPPKKEATSHSPSEYTSALGWFLAHQKIVLKGVDMTLYWEDGRVTPIKPLSLIASNHNGRYKFKGHASLIGKSPSVLTLLGDLDLPGGFTSNARGSIYVSAEQVNFKDWKTFFAMWPHQIASGRGEVQVWLDINHAQLASAQARVQLRDLVWQRESNHKRQKVDQLSANMAWSNTLDGWRFMADKVRLKANKVTWPENAITVTEEKDTGDRRVFVRTILISPLQKLLEDAFDIKNPWLDMHPKGRLTNTQIVLHDDKPIYVLSRFTGLSWQPSKDIPAVKNLSGALTWEPHAGRIHLDGENVIIQFKHKPDFKADVVNAALLWRKKDETWRFDLTQGALQHAHGLFHAKGSLTGVSKASKGKLNAELAYELQEATYWMRYLPESGLKPKLKSWLLNDITRIEQTSGRVLVRGPIANFPFDDNSGVFAVKSTISGVDLRFNPEWPLTKSIIGSLNLDKRTLTSEISQADFNGLPIEFASLKVTDLGLDKEVMTVDGKLEAPVEGMQHYIAHSPLHKRLFKLDALKFRHQAKLNLKIRFPFYKTPEGPEVLGKIKFDDNQLYLKDVPTNFYLNHLKGSLAFDTHGVLDSRLSASLLDEPLKLHINSFYGKQPYLGIKLDGFLSAQGLSQVANGPLLKATTGRAPFSGEIKITNDEDDLDTVQLSSKLKGIGIMLPEPFGKQPQEEVTLDILTRFNLNQGIRLQANYHDSLKSDLWFGGKATSFALARGEVRVGGGKPVLSTIPGASINGHLKSLDIKAWQTALHDDGRVHQPNHDTLAWLAGFSTMSIQVDTLTAFDQQYDQVEVEGKNQSNSVWDFDVKQKDIFANITYAPKQNKVSGFLSELRLPELKFDDDAAEAKPHSLTFAPKDTPNLDIKIDKVAVGDVDAGMLEIKGVQKSEALWHVNLMRLKSEAYEFKLKGDWKAGNTAETRVFMQLGVNDLAKALKNWGVTPVVEAKSGNIEFEGGWDAAPYDFSLKSVTGKMGIVFKDGRITNLSPETEKKIGIGKLLSILSLQTIPRRLKLDFSDLSKPGYFFDKFDGYFVLAHGIMETEDSTIDGPVARASMKGSLNLDKQLYDISLHITPHVTASLPIVATIAGGPVAGVATWVASKIINQGMEKISGYTYEVTGPWQEPVVKQVHIFKKQPVNTTH